VVLDDYSLLVLAYSSEFKNWWRLVMASEVRIRREDEGRYVGSGLRARRGRLSDWRSEIRENGRD